jgi:hypothetical protein
MALCNLHDPQTGCYREYREPSGRQTLVAASPWVSSRRWEKSSLDIHIIHDGTQKGALKVGVQLCLQNIA